jgi:D-alanyl-D-alanine carboxypeptidase
MAKRRDAHLVRFGRDRRWPAMLGGGLCLAAIVALVAAPPGLFASSSANRAAGFEAALKREVAQLRVPGASAAVIQRGQPLWAGSTGTKVVGGGDAVTQQTLFITASTAKTVTAAMTLRLVDEGKLGLDETVGRFLPGLRDGKRITVRELLQNTSGLPNYLTAPRIQQLIASDPRHAWTRAEVLRAVGWPRFRPGSRAMYSDSNYIALGGVIEAVTAMPLEDAFERLIRNPLGLTSSSWRYDNSQIGRFAHPNLESSNGTVSDLWSSGAIPTGHWGEVWTDGGLASTATELAMVAHATVMGPLLKRSTRTAMLDFQNNDGSGLGVLSRKFLGRDWVGHAGVWAGFTSQHWTFRRRGLTIAVLTNLETPGGVNPAEEIFKALAQVALSG